MELSASLEDYLEAIHLLSQQEGHAHVTGIAEQLGLSKPSVHRAIAQLREAGMVQQEPYGHITLTDQGGRHAEFVAQRHGLLKRFLHEVLKVEEEMAEEEACQMEHALSPETAQKLSAYLDQVLKAKT